MVKNEMDNLLNWAKSFRKYSNLKHQAKAKHNEKLLSPQTLLLVQPQFRKGTSRNKGIASLPPSHLNTFDYVYSEFCTVSA